MRLGNFAPARALQAAASNRLASADQSSQVITELVRGCGTRCGDRGKAEEAVVEVRILAVDEGHTGLAQLRGISSTILVEEIMGADADDGGRNALQIRQYWRGLDRPLCCGAQ